MEITVHGEIYDATGQHINLTPQQHAMVVMEKEGLYLPINTHLKYLYRPTNIQPAAEVVNINNTTLMQHPFFPTVYVSRRNRVFDAETWKWEKPSDILDEVLFGFLSKDTVIDLGEERLYHIPSNTINGVRYTRGSNIENYPSSSTIKFHHPLYPDVYCDITGKAYKETKDDAFTIWISGRVKFYADEWKYFSKQKFAYECFNNKIVPDNMKVVVKDKSLAFPFVKENLSLVAYEGVDTDNLLLHPKYKHYGVTKDTYEVFSVNAGKVIKTTNIVTIYNSFSHYKIYYNKEKFIYECLHQRLLNENEFVVSGELFDTTVDSFVYQGVIYNNTTNPNMYKSADGRIFYVPYERVLPVIDGFINIGTRYKPKLVPIPI